MNFINPYADYNNSEDFQIDAKGVQILIEKYINDIKANTMHEKTQKQSADIYVGQAGIAFMWLRLLELDNCSIAHKDILKLAKEYIDDAKKRGKPKHCKHDCAFLCGSAGIYCISMAISHLRNKKTDFDNDLKDFSSGFDVCKPVNYSPDGGDEILVGRAGYLSGIYWISQTIGMPDLFNEQQVLNVCESIVESGRLYSKMTNSAFPLMYQYHGSEYLGAAHGISSIYHMLLQSSWFKKESGIVDFSNKCKEIKISIDTLLELQLEDGNFPIDFKRKKRDKELIHWCHGGPGIIYLFAKSYITFGDEKYLSACKKIGDLVWTNGLLLKGPGICHGIAGNGYVFLILYRLTSDKKYLYRASKFAEFLTDPNFIRLARTPDRPYSLYEGLAGTVCFLIDLLQPEKAYFPFMDVFN